MRFCQGLGLGGEWSGAALPSSEYAVPGKRSQAAMWPQLGAPFSFFREPDEATLSTVTGFLAIGMFLMGVIFGHMAAVLPELFPTNAGYTGSGIACNVSSILGVALGCAVRLQAVGWYLVAVPAVSLNPIIVMREAKDDDMTMTNGFTAHMQSPATPDVDSFVIGSGELAFFLLVRPTPAP